MLRLEDIHAGYGRTTILHGLSLEVEEGAIVAVLGRNGVGKTTLLKTIMGLVPLDSGAVSLGGEDVGRLPVHARARRGLAYVPQGREIFPRMSVVDNLRVAAHATGKTGVDSRVEQLLDVFPALTRKRRDRGGSLSGGQQQMLAIARALITEPRVLLLDEPSEGVQPSIVQEIGETVRRLADERGITVVLVEQNLDFASSLAKQAYLVDKGQIVRALPAENLLSDKDLQHEYLGV